MSMENQSESFKSLTCICTPRKESNSQKLTLKSKTTHKPGKQTKLIREKALKSASRCYSSSINSKPTWYIDQTLHIYEIPILIYIWLMPELPRWFSGKESTCQCKTCRFDPWVREIPWNRKWQTTPVFFPGKS